MKHICRWSFVICHLSFVVCLAACARPDAAWERVHESGILRVGMDASFPPFEATGGDGTLVGFDVDLARELGQRLRVEVQFVANLPYDGLYDALAVNRVDVVISALVVNPARMADFAYSAPYFDSGQVLVVREKPDMSRKNCQVSDLDGCTLAVEFGTQGDLEARKWAQESSDLTVVHYQTAAEALAAVAAGEADGALVDHVSALEAMAKTLGVSENPKGFALVIVGEPVVEEPYVVAVRHDSQRLLRAINEALAEMKADGTLEMLVTEWLLGESS
ncbi:MAG: ABC transporter substrate-binding protein [Chloroflexota bacterium]|nr:ABC transporter substrate-binding protein [Chloroflexota bacterium]